MADNTHIEWTDASWNPVRASRAEPGDEATPLKGWHCEHVSEGCRNCYAEGVNHRFGTDLAYKPGHRGQLTHYLDDKVLLAPLRWKRPRRIFLSSMTDVFGAWVTDEMLDRILAVMALTPQHTYQVLTKRPERAREYLTGDRGELKAAITVNSIRIKGVDPRPVQWPVPNVWLGTSVEEQRAADERIPHLRATPAAKRFLSCEPLLGPLELEPYLFDGEVDWVIVGGESGKNARPMHPDWARALRDQCQAAGVPFFFKQWGNWAPCEIREGGELNPPQPLTRMMQWRRWHDGSTVGIEPGQTVDQWFRPGTVLAIPGGKKAAGRQLDGRTWDAVPS